MTTHTTKEITCYGQTNGFDWSQEWYESASRDAGRRARQLRKAGYRAVVCDAGMQVTPVGLVKMTMVDIRGGELANLPVVKIVRL